MATEVKRVYDLEIKGTDSLNELKNAVEQLNEKLKTLNETSKEYKDTLTQLTELQSKLANAMNGIGDSTQKTADSLKTVKDTATEATQNIKDMGDASEKTKENLENMGGANTIKELKAEIKSLKAEFSNLEIGSEGYIDVATQIANEERRLKAAMQGVKTTVDDAGESYNSLSIKMRQLKEEYHATNDEARRNELAPQIAEIQQKLKDMDAAVLVYSRNVGNYASAIDGLDASFVNWKQELRECKEALQQLDPASQAYADAMARAAELTHNITEQQEMLKNASNDIGDVLTNVQGVGTNLAAGFSALNAAMGLFGEENEEVQQAMLKVQQAMALVQGMQGMDGFWKNTKKLSTQMGLATKETNKNTAATKANANASKQDALSKKAEGAATESVIPAQKGLNAAMKANPIGFIIGLVASLVAILAIFKDKIMEMIGANKDMSAAFDKVKAVLSGFGNIIKKSVINPVKMAIIPIKTLAKIMIDLFKGDWSKIGDDFKDGMNEMKDTAIDTINVVGAFKEGYDKKSAELAEAARKKEAEARSKELDEIIKDNEAKYKSDWKYTEAGKKAYMEYFKSLTEMYDQDSEDYKQALRDKEVFLREFREHQMEEAKEQEAWELRVGQAYYGADYKYSEEWYNKKYKKWKEIEDQKWLYEMTNQMDAYEKHYVEWQEFLNDYNNHWKRKAEERQRTEEQLLQKFKSKFEKYLDFTDVLKMQSMDAEKIWNSGVTYYKQNLIEVYDYTEEEADKIISMLEEKTINELWDNLSKGTREKLEKTLYEANNRTKQFIDDLDASLSIMRLKVGIDFPEGELDNIITRFDLLKVNLDKQLLEVDSSINVMVNSYSRMYGVTAEEAKKALASISPEFQKLIDKQKELNNDLSKNEAERFQKISDIYKQLLKEETEDLQKAYDEASKYNEKRNELLRTEAERTSEEFGFITDAYINNSIQQYNRGKEEINSYYDYLHEFYNRMLNTYLEYSQSEFLSEEEKKNATEEAEKYKTLITQVEADRRIEILKNEIDAVKAWKDQFKSLASSAADSLGNIADYYQGIIDIEKIKIDQDLEDKKISEKQAKERYALMEDEYKKVQNFQAAQAMINGLSAAVSAYQSLASIPYVGPVLGAAAAAAALAAAIVNVQKIKATRMDNPYGSGSGGGGGSTNFQLPSVMEMEPSYVQNQTGMSDIDELNNDGRGSGNGRERGETAIKAYIVESEVSASQELARKRSNEVTF